MALPTIVTPTYQITLPSNNLKLEVRPFLVKEEKILLMALEGGSSEQEMQNAIIQILSNCVLTEGIDFLNLPVFDVEYLFLQLRAKSVGEIAEPFVTCPECSAGFPISVNISKLKVKSKEKNVTNRIILDDTGTLGITLKYPTLKTSFETTDTSDGYLYSLVSCIQEIYTEEEVFNAEEHTKEELLEFVENLQSFQLDKMLDFYRNMPSLEYTKACECKECEHKFKVNLRGLKDFFM